MVEPAPAQFLGFLVSNIAIRGSGSWGNSQCSWEAHELPQATASYRPQQPWGGSGWSLAPRCDSSDKLPVANAL